LATFFRELTSSSGAAVRGTRQRVRPEHYRTARQPRIQLRERLKREASGDVHQREIGERRGRGRGSQQIHGGMSYFKALIFKDAGESAAQHGLIAYQTNFRHKTPPGTL
jgi:hypothetical protein